MTTSLLKNGFSEARVSIPYGDADQIFARLRQHFPHHFLMESKQVSLFSGRFSLIGLDACLRVSGKDERFTLQALNERGEYILNELPDTCFSMSDDLERKPGTLSGTIVASDELIEEHQRSKKVNIATVIRVLLDQFACDSQTLMGLYGAFSYDFIRLFEDLEDQLETNEVPDFQLMFFDSFLFFDHIKEQAFIIAQRPQPSDLKPVVEQLQSLMEQAEEQTADCGISEAGFLLSQSDFEGMVQRAKQHIRQGDVFQVVFSNPLKARFQGDAFALYQRYREKNPSPYLFYYDFGEEQLVGASPEMMVRCEQGRVHLRPIAGTIHRGVDPIDDHDQMLELLNNPKERAELDMLIDLGRNDLSRICQPDIRIDDYRFVERYSRVMHTVAHLSGDLREGYSGLDALISCLNAGTLTGAPKIEAMRLIERSEPERRGYYGGAVGQLTFSGEVDTAIMIRTAHIRGDQLRYQSGAGIVYDSDPEKEYQETLHKAQAFFDTFPSS